MFTSQLALGFALAAGLVTAAGAPAQPPASGAAAAPAAKPDPRADALSEAARKGDAAAVQQLLDQGVDVNTKFRYDRTALSFASDRGHAAVVKLLLERGADPNVKDTFYGATSLNWASRPAMERKPEHAEVVRLLLKHGAQGQADALMAAVSEGDAPMVKGILEHGGLAFDALADALEAAAAEKNEAVTAALAAGGAKPRPVVTLTPAQLERCAGTYSNGNTNVTLAVKEGQLQGGPPGQNLTLVPRSDTTFGVAGQPGVSLVFPSGTEPAATLTLNLRQGPPAVYKRVEGKP